MRPMNRIYALALGLSTVACVAVSSVCGCGPHDCELTLTCKEECQGECVPLPPLGFDGPALLWMGPVAELPSQCPERASQPVYTGYAGLDDANECPPCECTAPVCELPAGVTITDLALCDMGPAATVTPYTAPAGWDGTCASSGIVPAAMVNSISIAPATVRPCEPVQQHVPAMFEGLYWTTAALACAGEAIPGLCGDSGLTCLPSAEPPPPGFRQCIFYLGTGDPTCPPDYPDKETLYDTFEDTRGCTECGCMETQPSACAASVATFEDVNCSVPALPPEPAGCIDPAAMFPIGSITAQMTTNQPGACAATGGAPTGAAKPVGPHTFCCRPPP